MEVLIKTGLWPSLQRNLEKLAWGSDYPSLHRFNLFSPQQCSMNTPSKWCMQGNKRGQRTLVGHFYNPGFGRQDRHSWLKMYHGLLSFGLVVCEQIREYDSRNMDSCRQLLSHLFESRN